MSVIVTDTGFQPDDWTGGFSGQGDAANDTISLDVASDTDPETIALTPSLQMIRIDNGIRHPLQNS